MDGRQRLVQQAPNERRRFVVAMARIERERREREAAEELQRYRHWVVRNRQRDYAIELRRRAAQAAALDEEARRIRERLDEIEELQQSLRDEEEESRRDFEEIRYAPILEPPQQEMEALVFEIRQLEIDEVGPIRFHPPVVEAPQPALENLVFEFRMLGVDGDGHVDVNEPMEVDQDDEVEEEQPEEAMEVDNVAPPLPHIAPVYPLSPLPAPPAPSTSPIASTTSPAQESRQISSNSPVSAHIRVSHSPSVSPPVPIDSLTYAPPQDSSSPLPVASPTPPTLASPVVSPRIVKETPLRPARFPATSAQPIEPIPSTSQLVSDDSSATRIEVPRNCSVTSASPQGSSSSQSAASSALISAAGPSRDVGPTYEQMTPERPEEPMVATPSPVAEPSSDTIAVPEDAEPQQFIPSQMLPTISPAANVVVTPPRPTLEVLPSSSTSTVAPGTTASTSSANLPSTVHVGSRDSLDITPVLSQTYWIPRFDTPLTLVSNQTTLESSEASTPRQAATPFHFASPLSPSDWTASSSQALNDPVASLHSPQLEASPAASPTARPQASISGYPSPQVVAVPTSPALSTPRSTIRPQNTEGSSSSSLTSPSSTPRTAPTTDTAPTTERMARTTVGSPRIAAVTPPPAISASPASSTPFTVSGASPSSIVNTPSSAVSTPRPTTSGTASFSQVVIAPADLGSPQLSASPITSPTATVDSIDVADHSSTPEVLALASTEMDETPGNSSSMMPRTDSSLVVSPTRVRQGSPETVGSRPEAAPFSPRVTPRHSPDAPVTPPPSAAAESLADSTSSTSRKRSRETSEDDSSPEKVVATSSLVANRNSPVASTPMTTTTTTSFGSAPQTSPSTGSASLSQVLNAVADDLDSPQVAASATATRDPIDNTGSPSTSQVCDAPITPATPSPRSTSRPQTPGRSSPSSETGASSLNLASTQADDSIVDSPPTSSSTAQMARTSIASLPISAVTPPVPVPVSSASSSQDVVSPVAAHMPPTRAVSPTVSPRTSSSGSVAGPSSSTSQVVAAIPPTATPQMSPRSTSAAGSSLNSSSTSGLLAGPGNSGPSTSASGSFSAPQVATTSANTSPKPGPSGVVVPIDVQMTPARPETPRVATPSPVAVQTPPPIRQVSPMFDAPLPQQATPPRAQSPQQQATPSPQRAASPPASPPQARYLPPASPPPQGGNSPPGTPSSSGSSSPANSPPRSPGSPAGNPPSTPSSSGSPPPSPSPPPTPPAGGPIRRPRRRRVVPASDRWLRSQPRVRPEGWNPIPYDEAEIELDDMDELLQELEELLTTLRDYDYGQRGLDVTRAIQSLRTTARRLARTHYSRGELYGLEFRLNNLRAQLGIPN